ncbi:MAG: acetolactate synthase large subunit [Thermoproteota archaeon]|nr:acetolactate synthase large subunit [Thermoproteota archaeon]
MEDRLTQRERISTDDGKTTTVAKLLVRCLENEGVKYVFGIPGEENIHFIDALGSSSIRYILVHHEQSASFMAEMYGRVTGKAGVCSATLGPGAINLLLGTADAYTDSVPLVAISAQVGLNRQYKETHQLVDLVSMFKPVTKWAAEIKIPSAVPEMVRKTFKVAQTERPGSCYLGIPQDLERVQVSSTLQPLLPSQVYDSAPSPSQISRAAKVLNDAKSPIILAGHGAARDDAQDALVRFSECLQIPVATTFMGKGVFPDKHPNALGTVGFMRRDYVNFGFDLADLLICVGYDLQEFDPVRINPKGDKKIIHISRYPAEVDAHYTVTVGIQSDTSMALDELAKVVRSKEGPKAENCKIVDLLRGELEEGARDDSFPVRPQRIVSDTRLALGESDIVLVDTGAVKMWMARLYPTYKPNTCLISNGLSTMAFALPGAIAVKLACPERKVLAVAGDGGFLMLGSELATAVREHVPIVVLIWEDKSYGLIKWKMDLELGHHSSVDFQTPDFVKYAESFGAKGHRINRTDKLLPTLQSALEDKDAVSVITCPVDYSQNMELTNKLGLVTEAL